MFYIIPDTEMAQVNETLSDGGKDFTASIPQSV